MSIEILDRGACKAAGLMIFNPFPGSNVFSGLGVSAIESVDLENVRVTLVEPIAAAEFLALLGPRSVSAAENCDIVWESDTTFLLHNQLPDEIVIIDVMIFRLVNRGGFTSAAIEMTPTEFRDAVFAASAEVDGFYLSEQGSPTDPPLTPWTRYNPVGVPPSIDRLFDQVNVTHSPGSSGAAMPQLVLGGASNGRTAARFTAVPASNMLTGATIADATGDRLGLLFIGRMRTSPPLADAKVLAYAKAAPVTMDMQFLATGDLQFRILYDDGGVGAFDTASEPFNSTAPMAMGLFASNPHQRYLNGVLTPMAETAGIFDAGGGELRLALGRGGFGDATNPGDFDCWCAIRFRMTSDAMPAGFDTIMGLARAFFQEPGL